MTQNGKYSTGVILTQKRKAFPAFPSAAAFLAQERRKLCARTDGVLRKNDQRHAQGFQRFCQTKENPPHKHRFSRRPDVTQTAPKSKHGHLTNPPHCGPPHGTSATQCNFSFEQPRPTEENSYLCLP